MMEGTRDRRPFWAQSASGYPPVDEVEAEHGNSGSSPGIGPENPSWRNPIHTQTIDFSCSASTSSNSADRVNAVTGSGLVFAEGEESVDMCKAIDDMRRESRDEGRAEGLAEGIRSLMETLGMSALQAMDALRIPAEDRKALLAML